MTYCTTCQSPLGELLVAASERAVTGVYFLDQRYFPREVDSWQQNAEIVPLMRAVEQLNRYFAGTLRAFDLPLAPAGTPFQRAVWDAIAMVPYGETISYGELARRAGSPGKARAAGTATGQNPIGIIVPCHRIIGANGKLTGYAGGLERKRALLALEAEHSPEQLFQPATA
jgi:methylated-DNA-[protein]-cysteine S-methyltransferase